MILLFDDPNAYEYLYENKAGCMDSLRELLEQRTGKVIEIQLKKNESGRAAADVVPDLRDLIHFDIVEENF